MHKEQIKKQNKVRTTKQAKNPYKQNKQMVGQKQTRTNAGNEAV